ncbi:heterokaryon incompatibility protein-domain-containing protein [Bisporella sp. PMI_857]|nr:heterokaryon incompatibility protein-domain-containing protein [Bisporella sp. PMI_857]
MAYGQRQQPQGSLNWQQKPYGYQVVKSLSKSWESAVLPVAAFSVTAIEETNFMVRIPLTYPYKAFRILRYYESIFSLLCVALVSCRLRLTLGLVNSPEQPEKLPKIYSQVLVLRISKEAEHPSKPSSLFSLVEANLQEDPNYEALSYTWGETTYYDGFTYHWDSGPPRTYPIEIHGSGLLQITTNLNEFLQHLAQSAPNGTSTRRIWADQICINQKDIKERNSQVAIMKEIYQSAWRTLIWLGNQDADVLAVLNLLHAVATPEFNHDQELSGTLLRDLQQRVKTVLYSESGLDENSCNGYIKSLINTFNKPWFSRAWIVQEAALSVFPIILLGSEEIDFRLLHYLLVVVAKIESGASGSLGLRSSQLLRSRGAQTVRHVERCRRKAISRSQNSHSFLEILRRLAFSMDATDSRDQVYAFLAFQDPRGEQIVPDYSLDTSAAYTMISASIARSTKSLSIFGLIRGSKYPGLLPSWAIDWRLNKSTQGTPFDIDGKDNFDACKGYLYKPMNASSQLSKVLPVRGKIIGQVAVVSSVAHEPQQQVPQAWRLEEVVESLVLGSRSQGTQFPLPSSDSELMKRVLAVLMAQDMRGFTSDTQRENSLDKMLRAYHNYERVVKKDTTLEDASELGELVQRLARRILLCVKKRVFCSRDGLIGLGPQHISENDFICILHGSRVPCILRKQCYGWKVIGQCFYERWMYGELVDWKEEGDPFDLI